MKNCQKLQKSKIYRKKSKNVIYFSNKTKKKDLLKSKINQKNK